MDLAVCGCRGWTFIHLLLSYYLANKWNLHVRSQGLEIPILIEEKKEKLKLPTTAITKN